MAIVEQLELGVSEALPRGRTGGVILIEGQDLIEHITILGFRASVWGVQHLLPFAAKGSRQKTVTRMGTAF